MKNNYEIPPPQLPCSSKTSKLLYLFLDVKSKDMTLFSNNIIELYKKYLEAIQYMVVNHII